MAQDAKAQADCVRTPQVHALKLHWMYITLFMQQYYFLINNMITFIIYNVEKFIWVDLKIHHVLIYQPKFCEGKGSHGEQFKDAEIIGDKQSQKAEVDIKAFHFCKNMKSK